MPLPAGEWKAWGRLDGCTSWKAMICLIFPVSDGNSGVNLRVPNIGMPSGVTFAQLLIRN